MADKSMPAVVNRQRPQALLTEDLARGAEAAPERVAGQWFRRPAEPQRSDERHLWRRAEPQPLGLPLRQVGQRHTIRPSRTAFFDRRQHQATYFAFIKNRTAK